MHSPQSVSGHPRLSFAPTVGDHRESIAEHKQTENSSGTEESAPPLDFVLNDEIRGAISAIRRESAVTRGRQAQPLPAIEFNGEPSKFRAWMTKVRDILTYYGNFALLKYETPTVTHITSCLNPDVKASRQMIHAAEVIGAEDMEHITGELGRLWLFLRNSVTSAHDKALIADIPFPNALHVWNTLVAHYTQQDVNMAQSLMDEFVRIEQSANESMSMYFARMSNIVLALNEAGDPPKLKHTIDFFVKGALPVFDHAIEKIRGIPVGGISWNAVGEKLIRAEQFINYRLKTSESQRAPIIERSTPSSQSASVYAAMDSNLKQCFNCHERGHSSRDCTKTAKVCGTCKKTGHPTALCFNGANRANRPPSWGARQAPVAAQANLTHSSNFTPINQGSFHATF